MQNTEFSSQDDLDTMEIKDNEPEEQTTQKMKADDEPDYYSASDSKKTLSANLSHHDNDNETMHSDNESSFDGMQFLYDTINILKPVVTNKTTDHQTASRYITFLEKLIQRIKDDTVAVFPNFREYLYCKAEGISKECFYETDSLQDFKELMNICQFAINLNTSGHSLQLFTYSPYTFDALGVYMVGNSMLTEIKKNEQEEEITSTMQAYNNNLILI